jgi:hypothetical protein
MVESKDDRMLIIGIRRRRTDGGHRLDLREERLGRRQERLDYRIDRGEMGLPHAQLVGGLTI